MVVAAGFVAVADIVVVVGIVVVVAFVVAVEIAVVVEIVVVVETVVVAVETVAVEVDPDYNLGFADGIFLHFRHVADLVYFLHHFCDQVDIGYPGPDLAGHPGFVRLQVAGF